MINSESSRLFKKTKVIDEQLRDLEIDYEAKFETYQSSGRDKKLQKLKVDFTEKRTILVKKKEKYNVELKNLWRKKELETQMRQRTYSKMQLFMDTVKELEGIDRKPAQRQMLIKYLVNTGKFSDIEAVNYIKRMLHEASIYESRPDHYNRV